MGYINSCPRIDIIQNNFPLPIILKSIFIISTIAMFILALSSKAYAHSMGDQSDNPPPYWPYHAFLVSTGFIFMAAGMLTARYKKGRRWWLKAHKTAGLSGAFLAVIGILMAAYLVSTYLEMIFVKETHAYLGIGAALFVIITPIAGFMQFRRKDMRIRQAHKWLGRIALILMLGNVIAGLQMMLK